jgi:hypothetical protein
MRDMAASQEANVERSADIIFFPDFFAFLENVLDGVAGSYVGRDDRKSRRSVASARATCVGASFGRRPSVSS